MGSVAFRESIGRFLMKEEQSGRCRRGISRGIQSTRDPFEFQKTSECTVVACRLHSLFLAGRILGVFACVAVEGPRRRHKLTKDYDKPGAVTHACNHSTETISQVED